MNLSTSEQQRYARHLILPGFGFEGQETLKRSKVLVVGAGGLGAPILQYLTAAGVGTIGIVDSDVVEESNLQRQVLYTQDDLNILKVQAAIDRLQSQNPFITFIPHPIRIDSSNAMALIEPYDLVIDGTDNFPTRYLLNDACVLLDKPLIYGSIHQFEGQVSVFNYQDGPNYRDLFPTPPPPEMVPNCAEGGVLGVLPGIIGSIQALEAIKVLCQIGDTLSGKIFLMDALSMTSRTIRIRKQPSNPISGDHPTIQALIDYQEFCAGPAAATEVLSIQVDQLQDWLKNDPAPVLIDVREPREYALGHLEAIHIPLSALEQSIEQIPTQGKVVFYCKGGTRSAQAIRSLQEHPNSNSFYSLEGGITAWRDQYDPALQVL